VDGLTQAPLAGAEVTITALPAEFSRRLTLLAAANAEEWKRRAERPDKTRSRTDGLFYFLDLPDGEYGLRAVLPNCGQRYAPAKQVARVSWAAVDALDKQNAVGERLNKMWVKLTLQPTTVRGKVIDAEHNTVITLAEVRMKNSGERTFSDLQGDFLLSPVQPSKSKRLLQAFAQGYEPAEEEIAITAVGHSYPKDLKLKRRSREQFA
jgi:hypothetical protein